MDIIKQAEEVVNQKIKRDMTFWEYRKWQKGNESFYSSLKFWLSSNNGSRNELR